MARSLKKNFPKITYIYLSLFHLSMGGCQLGNSGLIPLNSTNSLFSLGRVDDFEQDRSNPDNWNEHFSSSLLCTYR